MDKKYQVFISSTYKDLIEEREKVRDVILSMYHFPIGMEMFNAADEEQWEIIQETIDSSDYYVLILGKRYGSIIPEGKPDAGMSYTEKEYRYAVSQGIPVLTFIKSDSVVTADKMDTEPDKIAKQRALVDEITGTRESDWFGSVEELGTKVLLALHKQMDRKKRPGWVRGDRFDLDASLNELLVLNKRIRELEDENKKLRESVQQRKPALSVSVQFVGTVEEPLEVDSDNIPEENEVDDILPTSETVQRKHVPEKGYLPYVEPLQIEDVPYEVKDLVTQDVIDEYNTKLPDKKTVDAYDESMRVYNEIRKNGQLLDFIVSNGGTAKATDVNITLEFPDSFLIMKRSEAERLSEPQKPHIPANPIDEAMSQKYITGNAGSALKQIIHLMSDSYAGLGFSKASAFDLSSAIVASDFSANWSVDIDRNTVKIWSRDILHTYAETTDSLCVIPMQKGTFNIKVLMMCEEYITPEESELEIVVE